MQIWPNQLTWLGVVAILVPVVIAIFSRRFTVVLGALFFALASVCILLAPANAAEIVAAGFYLLPPAEGAVRPIPIRAPSSRDAATGHTSGKRQHAPIY
jgi:hypothetical protein